MGKTQIRKLGCEKKENKHGPFRHHRPSGSIPSMSTAQDVENGLAKPDAAVEAWGDSTAPSTTGAGPEQDAAPKDGEKAESGRWRGGRAQLRALKEGLLAKCRFRRNWYRFRMRPGCVRMRRDASGCVGILNSGKFR